MINIEVRRRRSSVTQGSADIYINNKFIMNFNDNIYLKNHDGTFTNGFHTIENAQHYGEVINGWGSITPDSEFIFGMLYHPYDNVYNYSKLFKEAVVVADNV